MQKAFTILLIVFTVILSIAFVNDNPGSRKLRKIYSRPSAEWPKPFIDSGIVWQELGILPKSPIEHQKDSLRHLIELGKILFFDTRLSSSGKIACATCHQPELSWTDGKRVSLGHEGARNKRNSPTIQNVWFYKKLFWDGRSKDLEDQAFAPINSESEMHNDMRTLPRQLKDIKGYPSLFELAFGDPAIDPDRIAHAIAVFERTVVSQPSRFDKFLAGDKKALSDDELKGLHLFRTKARCMNCHHGPLFSDNQFHNNGAAFDDKGLYQVTHKDADIGKLKTPSLRDVFYTGPWMQAGQYDDLELVISLYSSMKFPGYDISSKHIRHLGLNSKEKENLLAFLKSISERPLPFVKPVLPH